MSLELTEDEAKRVRARVLRVHDLLQAKYGRLSRNGKSAPLDELIRIILSQNTTEAHSHAIFDLLKKRFKDWENLMAASPQAISGAIRNGGLYRLKALRIKRILKRIYRDRKNLSLDFLSEMDSAQAMKYLVSLKGIGSRMASSLLLFSLKKPVMPVNAHVERVSKRLGWVWATASLDQMQALFNRVTPRYMVGSLYAQLVQHGRLTCKLKDPRCASCVIRRDCDFFHKKKRDSSLVAPSTNPAGRRDS